MLVKHETAIILSRKHFTKEKLLEGINEIFNNKEKYLKNAQELAKKLPKPDGDKNAVKKIVKILEQKGLI